MKYTLLLLSLLLTFALSCNAGQFQDQNSVCQPCPSNTFSLDGNGTACQDCTGCTECQATTGDCTSCQAGKQPTTGTCEACPTGQFSLGDAACQACDSSCLTCDSTNGNCVTCQSGKGLSGSVCDDCATDQFTNQNSFCQACDSSCLTCDGELSTNCLSCNLDFGLVNNECTICPNGTTSDGTGPCQECTTANCSQCDQNDICQECAQGYTLLDDKQCGYPCSDVVTNCSLCQFNDVCAVCQTGFTLDSSNNVCNVETNCTDFCEVCSNSTSCAQCQSGYTLFNNSCVDNCGVDNCINCTDDVCQECLETYILLGTTSCVIQCNIENCLSCAPAQLNQCQTCSSGFSLSTDKSKCVTCNVVNCDTCITNNVCGSCTGSLINQNGICITCQVDNCLSCSTNNNCLACAEGYALNPDSVTTNANQCIACNDPCSTCYSDGSCKTCQTPYSPVQLTQGDSCFLCSDPSCLSCNDNTAGSCTQCPQTMTLVNGTCQTICSEGCQTCSNSTVCQSCFAQFVFADGDTCSLCPNAPACKMCDATNNNQCTQCYDGYWLNSENVCVACPAYCKTCTSSTYCTVLFNPVGFTLLYVSSTVNQLAACDNGCYYCSNINPEQCIKCMHGFYLTTDNYCQPCLAASNCATCSASDAALCTSCRPDSYLADDGSCMPCELPCASCGNMNTSMCTSCVQGYVFVESDNTCQLQSDINGLFSVEPVDSCANSQITTDANGTNVVTCTLCIQGYTLTSGGCTPCAEGCQFCDPDQITTCLVCAPGYQLDSNNVCTTVSGTTCPWGCDSCTDLACFSCVQGLILNQNFQCQYPCMSPCATCSNTNPFSCLSCVQGYNLINGACQADTSCSTDGSCIVCPTGFTLAADNTDIQIVQTCTTCTSSSNCARCMSAQPAVCTSCSYGMYLNGTVCSSCSDSCASCINLAQCTKCAAGFVDQQPGTFQPSRLTVGFANCVACTSPCATCSGNVDTCSSCITGFTLSGDVCISDFNFAINAVFAVTLATFQANYNSFLQQIADSAGVKIRNILIKSISSGSVVVNMQVTSLNPAGSAAAVASQNNLNNLLTSGNIAGMTVSSFTLSTNGGTNGGDDDGSGLSTTTIIILAVCIPGGVLLIGLGIFLIYCYRKKQQETTYAPQSGWNSGRSMSSSRGVELMGYGNQNSRGSGYNNQGFNNNNGGFNNSGYGTMNSTDRHRQQQRQAFL